MGVLDCRCKPPMSRGTRLSENCSQLSALPDPLGTSALRSKGKPDWMDSSVVLSSAGSFSVNIPSLKWEKELGLPRSVLGELVWPVRTSSGVESACFMAGPSSVPWDEITESSVKLVIRAWSEQMRIRKGGGQRRDESRFTASKVTAKTVIFSAAEIHWRVLSSIVTYSI